MTSSIAQSIYSGMISGIACPEGAKDMDQAKKVRENRLRRAAERQGLRLMKSKRRDPRALDYGMYWLIKGQRGEARGSGRNAIIGGERMTLDQVEAYLMGEHDG
jgi:hypothetical protein